jgi:hypothetical protein
MNSHLLSFSVALSYGRLATVSRGVFVQIKLATDAIARHIIDARVDSASTYSVFGRQWADILGLDWEAGEPMVIATAVGVFYAHPHEVTIHLLDFEWPAWVAFAEWDTTPPSPARDVLGLMGFFDHFLVAIDDQSEIVYLEPRF